MDHLVDSLVAQLPVAIAWLTTGGGGLILWNSWKKWRDGVAQEQKEVEQQKLKEKILGQGLYELEARNRRKLQEYASQLRYIALGKGVCPDELPPFPDLENVKEVYKDFDGI